jgi:hypothetical protein
MNHTAPLPEPKEFDCREATRMKAYYQTLLRMPDVFRFCGNIPSDEVISFYECLNRGITTEAGHRDKRYKLLLAGGTPPSCQLKTFPIVRIRVSCWPTVMMNQVRGMVDGRRPCGGCVPKHGSRKLEGEKTRDRRLLRRHRFLCHPPWSRRLLSSRHRSRQPIHVLWLIRNRRHPRRHPPPSPTRRARRLSSSLRSSGRLLRAGENRRIVIGLGSPGAV